MKKGVSKLLTLSTGHIRPETDAMLQGLTEDRWPFSGSRVAYGYFVYAHDEQPDGCPEEVWAACVHARQLGCDHIYFDRDAPELENLESFGDRWSHAA